MARELIILPRFKRDYKRIRRHPEFDVDTLEYVFDLLIAGKPLPKEFVEHLRACSAFGRNDERFGLNSPPYHSTTVDAAHHRRLDVVERDLQTGDGGGHTKYANFFLKI